MMDTLLLARSLTSSKISYEDRTVIQAAARGLTRIYLYYQGAGNAAIGYMVLIGKGFSVESPEHLGGTEYAVEVSWE